MTPKIEIKVNTMSCAKICRVAFTIETNKAAGKAMFNLVIGIVSIVVNAVTIPIGLALIDQGQAKDRAKASTKNGIKKSRSSVSLRSKHIPQLLALFGGT